MLLRKNFSLDDNGICSLCDGSLLETRDHLFWKCEFSRKCWQSINISLEDNLDLPQLIATARSNFRRPFFFEVFATVAWNIWKQRNALIFDNISPTIRALVLFF
uniref:Uncharacterized protein n=1 Tax=Avena sativa TaxID=4498 RepID=A0ACD5VWL7_AVESA